MMASRSSNGQNGLFIALMVSHSIRSMAVDGSPSVEVVVQHDFEGSAGEFFAWRLWLGRRLTADG